MGCRPSRDSCGNTPSLDNPYIATSCGCRKCTEWREERCKRVAEAVQRRDMFASMKKEMAAVTQEQINIEFNKL